MGDLTKESPTVLRQMAQWRRDELNAREKTLARWAEWERDIEEIDAELARRRKAAQPESSL